MIVAVIGAGGFAGSSLSRHFKESGADVVDVTRATPLPEQAFDVVVDCNGDARRFWANENPDESLGINVHATRERTRALVYKTYVYLSSIDVYGPAGGERDRNGEDSPIDADTLDTYGLHKYQAEQAVRAAAARHIILRAGTLLGPGLKKNPVFDALNGNPIRQTPDSTLSLITLDRLAHALDKLLAAGAEGTYNVTASDPIDVATMLARAAEANGRDGGDFAFHEDLLSTRYDISVAKISHYVALPDSEAMLAEYLAGPR